MENILEVNQLCRHYANFFLDNISLKLPKGCIMGLIGENGAGKSTFIRLILNLIDRDCGEIKILGLDSLNENPNVKEHIGVVMDEVNFADHLTSKAVNHVMKHSFKTWDSAKFFSYLNRFSLPLDKCTKEFSKGMKMKLSLAVALSHDSQLLILDEPAAGLDPASREDLLDICMEFIQNEQNSILISSHILSDLEKICDYIALIHKGKLVFSEEKNDLLQKYALIHCTKEVLDSLDSKKIIAVRSHAFGQEALVLRKEIPSRLNPENTTLENIMIFLTKDGRSS